ncbi:MAG: hypothetical protein PHN49_09350 [Candidatus Omnitrophica bacterium]|nr:hypothetical protein [Candidatus Omnitrophota bacterium]MDD5671833.1 hypothetical protein [Candidatus Omnitrophota bacterium]
MTNRASDSYFVFFGHRNFLPIKTILLFAAVLMMMPQPSYGSRPEKQSPECEAMYNEIETALDKANYCEHDSDCKVLMLGGPYIEFGCHHFVNKDTDTRAFMKKMQKYDERCDQMINDCNFVDKSRCVANKCVAV